MLLFKCFFFKKLSFNIRFRFSVKIDIDLKSQLALIFDRLVSLSCVEETFDVGESIY